MFICCIAKVLTDDHIWELSDADDQISAECKMSLSVKFKDYSDVFLDEDTNILLKFSQYKYSIKLMSEQKLPYKPLYVLSEWELVIL